MIEPWELILHHTYTGTPGVVFDHSPGRGSHGTAVGLGPGDFVLDGAASGSGAVRFRRNGLISVTPTRGWDRLGAFRAEVVFRCDRPGGNGQIFDSRPLAVFAHFSDRTFDFGFKTADGLQRFGVTFDEIGVDPLAWTTAGVQHDGLGTVQILVNGETVKTWNDRPLQQVRPTELVTIGNGPDGALEFPGLIDDVKIWRPNPTKIKSDFTDRIVKHGLTDCWAEWGKKFRDALTLLKARNPECPAHIAFLIDHVMATVASALTHSPATRQAWERAVTDYQRLWSSGHVAQINQVLSALRDVLRSEGVDVEQSSAYHALINDRCFQELLRITPPLDCDPEFTRMLTGGRS